MNSLVAITIVFVVFAFGDLLATKKKYCLNVIYRIYYL